MGYGYLLYDSAYAFVNFEAPIGSGWPGRVLVLVPGRSWRLSESNKVAIYVTKELEIIV
jgi:hypothetical protein